LRSSIGGNFAPPQKEFKQYFDLGYKQVLSSNITSLGSGFHLEVGGNPGYWISDELGLYLFIGGSVLWFHDYKQGELDDYFIAQKEFESISTGSAELGYMGYFDCRFWLSTTSGSKFNGLYTY
jgi:hypothetical protein